MKIPIKIVVISAVIGMVFLPLASTTNALASTPVFGKKYQNGVGNITVWLDYGSGVGYWQSFIVNAANNWRNPGWSNPINMTFVSSNNGSNMDFYLRYNGFWGGVPGILAETRFYATSGAKVDPAVKNWYYTNIYINHDMYSSPYISNDMALGTTIHEMGHAFGLKHYSSNPNSIMCEATYRNVQRVKKTDNDAINILY